MAGRTIVASATNLLTRGYLVVPTDRMSPDGAPVNALFSVARAILRAFAFKVPQRAIAIIDTTSSDADWPELLRSQRPELAVLLKGLGLTVVEASDEARAVAATVRAALDDGDDCVVIGVDKRYAQLVSERVWWYDPHKDARYTSEMVRKRFGVSPQCVASWLALVGDDDALPGIAGIGAKGATQLVEQYGSIEAALAAGDAVTGRLGKALRAAGPEAVARELARARLGDATSDAPAIEGLCYTAPPQAELNALFTRLGFVEFLVADAASVSVTVCDREEVLKAELERLGEGPVAIEPLLEEDETLVGLALATGDGRALYAPLRGQGQCLSGSPALAAFVADRARPKIAHAREGLVVALSHAGLSLEGMVGDSAAASHLTEPSNWAPHDLPLVAKYVLGRALPEYETLVGTGARRKPFSSLQVRRIAELVGARADAVAQIWRALSPHVDRERLAEYLALSDVLVRIERTGILVSAPELSGAEADFALIEAELEREIAAHAGHGFNINSTKQLGDVLFEELKLPVVSHTKTGFSTASEALERIEHAHPIVSLVLRWRRLRRLRDSWLVALRKQIGSDGRVHSRFHPARSFSGELVNTNPDLGRVPGRTPEMARVRRAFVAADGHLLLSVDYNQLGLHVLAHLSRDPALVEPLRARADVHALTAAAVLDRPADKLTEAERQIGKVVNFATFAGQGPSALGLQLGVSAQEAKQLIARFDQRYAGVRAFQDEQLRLARERGYIVTISGRRWPIGGLASLDPMVRSYAERLARRATHEGSVCDVARRGLLDADRALRSRGLRAQPLALILDEVLFEVPKEELSEAASLAAAAMRGAFALEAPLVVGLEAGPSWAELAPL